MEVFLYIKSICLTGVKQAFKILQFQIYRDLTVQRCLHNFQDPQLAICKKRQEPLPSPSNDDNYPVQIFNFWGLMKLYFQSWHSSAYCLHFLRTVRCTCGLELCNHWHVGTCWTVSWILICWFLHAAAYTPRDLYSETMVSRRLARTLPYKFCRSTKWMFEEKCEDSFKIQWCTCMSIFFSE